MDSLEDVCTFAFGFPCMFFYRNDVFFRFDWQWCRFLLRFIEQAQLTFNIEIFRFFAGAAKELPGKILHLLTQTGNRSLVFFKQTLQRFRQLFQLLDSFLLLPDRIFLLYDFGIFCILSYRYSAPFQ